MANASEGYPNYDLTVGKSVFIMTDTNHWLGTLVKIDGPFTVTITNVFWVAMTGRLGEFTKHGKAQNMEVEQWHLPFKKVNYRDISPWPHPLPEATTPRNSNE